ncbi:hypothetical protein HN680_00345 [Candidatus Peregrinibacteria bacterium]|nr:hypothetical protein [Candidatus Peregrinibacteria bacterium]
MAKQDLVKRIFGLVDEIRESKNAIKKANLRHSVLSRKQRDFDKLKIKIIKKKLQIH